VKIVTILIAVLIVAAAGFVVWQRKSWTQDRDAQCAAARPLTAAMASRSQVIGTLGEPSSEYGRADWAALEKHFGRSQEPKLADIRERLPEGGRLLVYSRSHSIMFLYMDGSERALHATCFLQ
jgi:hypothetical protein